MSIVPGREHVLEIIGRPFGRTAFHMVTRGKTKHVLVFPKVFPELVNRRYEKLIGLTIEDLRNSGFYVGHSVVNHDEPIPRDRPFALSFIRAKDPSILTC